MMIGTQFRTWIEISKNAIKHNLGVFQRIIGKKVKLMAVVKSNAYGHGLLDFATIVGGLGADWLGVDSITEGLALRRAGMKKPILVLGYTLPKHFKEAAAKNISLAISSFENLKLISKLRVPINIHIKIDTGMHRQGFFAKDLPRVCEIIKQSKLINFQGLFTHFAAAKKPDSLKDTDKQIEVFRQAKTVVKSFGFNPICHAAASAGTLNYPEAHFDMVRVGIGLYGLWPSPETKKAMAKKINLQPELTWKTVIAEIKWVEKGAKVGYDFTETLRKNSKLAVLPVGYWHGLWRAFSGKAQVLIGGRRCKYIGRVSMDMIVVDVTNASKVKVGDVVVLLGKQGKEEITADELATIAGTTNYEIVTRLNPLIKKFYI